MNTAKYSLVKTKFGTFSIAWNEIGLVSVQFPLANEKSLATATVKKLKELDFSEIKAEKKLAPSMQRLAKKLVSHFEGKFQDFSDTPLAIKTTPFFKEVYEFCLNQLPSGKTMTYGEVAKAIGKPKSARAVGMAMAKNPIPMVIPCHRVLASTALTSKTKDKLCGFSAPGGIKTKKKILELEGVKLN